MERKEQSEGADGANRPVNREFDRVTRNTQKSRMHFLTTCNTIRFGSNQVMVIVTNNIIPLVQQQMLILGLHYRERSGSSSDANFLFRNLR